MHRFYVASENVRGDRAKISGDECKHLARVVRLKIGEPLVVFDGKGWEYEGNLESLDSKEALVKIRSRTYYPRESPLEVWLAQGIPKGDKMDLIIQKATELGVRGIIPVITERSVVRLTENKAEERQQRWQRIALEAAKQCRRALVPSVLKPMALDKLQSISGEKLLLVPWEEGGSPLKKVLQGERISLPVYIVIGPEGGLDPTEVEQLQEEGGIAVTLGPRILRTETAGLMTISVIMYQWGDAG